MGTVAKAQASPLWLVRHAQPLVAAGTCYGALDVAADAAATEAAAQALAQALPHDTRMALGHSPLQRCEQLSQSLRRHRPDLASKPDARLREMHFGDWEGRRWDAIAKADIDAWTADFADHAPGGGEALRSMLVRVDAALQAARQHAQARLAAGAASAPTVWITHAGVARCVSWLLQPAHTPPKTLSAAQWPTAAPGFGQWMQVNL